MHKSDNIYRPMAITSQEETNRRRNVSHLALPVKTYANDTLKGLRIVGARPVFNLAWTPTTLAIDLVVHLLANAELMFPGLPQLSPKQKHDYDLRKWQCLPTIARRR